MKQMIYTLLLLVGCGLVGHEPLDSLLPQKYHESVSKAYTGVASVMSNTDIIGSAVLLENGYIVTALHVVDFNGNGVIDQNEQRHKILIHNRQLFVEADVVSSGKRFSGDDWAILKPTVVIRSQVKIHHMPLSIGAPIFSINSFNGEGPLVIDGRVCRPDGKIPTNSITVYFGSSGGGIFCSKCQNLIGIVVAGRIQHRIHFLPSLSFYVKAETLRKAFSEL